MLTKEELPACPVATTVALIGSKWKLLIMRNLQMRTWRFNELKKDLDGISQKVLTDSLRSMENDGLVVRTVYAEVPPRVEYSLSELGKSMYPIIDAMGEWGRQYQKWLRAKPDKNKTHCKADYLSYSCGAFLYPRKRIKRGMANCHTSFKFVVMSAVMPDDAFCAEQILRFLR